ncbi:hypothetical protein Val02_34730 [Virgisporangium aliadipatigenens]|uniref:Disease resistance R13L4/SHOC-2-like LRR domain-containing protein n=1 Tax=Virgisporangium aliadipatigenens TaxID=741659 RepID=A0A8J4DRR9_9ACTN|nr:leucine-rich repeat domain-containing protein [Virgisporangium aliadipatigenens]GIJ46587.1 hypothetical protein Val02_34730 [Virgisporangium aliadipatigenens]
MADPFVDVATARATLAAPKGDGRLARALDPTNLATWLALDPPERRAVLAAAAGTVHEAMHKAANDRRRPEPERETLLADLAAVPKLDAKTAGRHLAAVVGDRGLLPGVTPTWAATCVAAYLPYGPEYPKIFHDTARIRFLAGDRDGVIDAVTQGRANGGSIWLIRDDALLAAMWDDPRYVALFTGPPEFDHLDAAILAAPHVRTVDHHAPAQDPPDGLARLVHLEKLVLRAGPSDRFVRALLTLPALTELIIHDDVAKVAAETLDALLAKLTTFRLTTHLWGELMTAAEARSLRAGIAGLPPSARLFQIAIQCRLDDGTPVEAASLDDVLSAVDSPLPYVRSRALHLLMERLESGLALAPGDAVLVAGDIGFTATELKERLGRIGVSVARTPGPKVRVSVVGERHKGAAHRHAAAGIALTTAERLRDLLDREAPTVIGAAAADRIRDLLASPDAANPAVALELMRTGGVPDGILAELLVFSRCTWLDKKLREQARKLFMKVAPASVTAAVRDRDTRFTVEPAVASPKPWQRNNYYDLRDAAGALAELSGGDIDAWDVVMFAYRMCGETALVLGWRGMDGVDERAFALPATREILLNSHTATRLPETFGNLPHLWSLSLNYAGLTALPESIGDLPALSVLHLEGNALTTLPDRVARLATLRELRLGGNRFPTFPRSVLALNGLETLDYAHYDKGLRTAGLPADFGALTGLRRLSLRDQNVGALPESMRAMTALEDLDLTSGRIDALPEWLADLPALAKLRLTAAKIADPASVEPVVTRLRARGTDVSAP